MIELLSAKHHRNGFDCGKEQLNRYLNIQAGQDARRKLSVCFVFIDRETNYVKGYYTLSNHSIPLDHFSEQIQKKLPKSYSSIPATLLGRLAVDLKHQGTGFGKILLIDALKRSYAISEEVGSLGVIVDPIDPEAERFYEKYGFIKLPDSGKMFISTLTLKALFE